MTDIPPVVPAGPDAAPPRRQVAAVILAAGKSTRAGFRHRLHGRIDGRTLVRVAAEAAVASGADPVIVVVGDHANEVRGAIDGMPLTVIDNPDFADGLATSLLAGFAPLPDAVVGAAIVPADMPGVTAATIGRLITAFLTLQGAEIVAPTYQGQRGNPVVWARRFFGPLAAISGDSGERDLLARYVASVVEVECGASVVIDVDAPEAFVAAPPRD